jgi:pimeloyl-ACP methyl ester carboxylesterase
MKLLKSPSNNYYFSEGKGKPMLLLHGFPDCAENFKHQLNFFGENGYQVITPFLPGYHPEDKELDTYQSLRIAEEMITFIKSITDKKISLFGHDWGASIAYGMAGLEPDLIDKMITVSVPHGINVGASFLSDGDQQRKSWYMFFFQLPIADLAVPNNNFNFINRLWIDWSPNWPEYKFYVDKTIEVLSKGNVLSKALAYYRCTFQESLQTERINSLTAELSAQKIKVPSLYLHGKNDGCIGVNLCEGMENFFDELEICILADCGHFLHIEKHKEVNKIILNFLSNR